MHTGTGRISKMPMYPMSLYESKESTGSISLRLLFDDPAYDIDGFLSDMTVEKLIFAACRGGWPASLDVTSQEAQLLIAKDYVNVICDEDISRVDGVRRQPALARLIMRSYARNICTLVKKSKMLADITVEMEKRRCQHLMIMFLPCNDCLS